MSSTNYTWVATLTGNIIIECWGAGGGGRNGQFNNVGGGGGGGAYARKTGYAVTSGVGYLASVADTTGAGSNGDRTLFVDIATCMAVGGDRAAFGGFGAGGLAGSCAGTVKFSGGDGGGPPVFVNDADGYGGGSSADDSSNGNAGVGGGSGGHTAGGAALPRGGAGGDGGVESTLGPPTWTGTPGADGVCPGGGGGGGCYANPGSSNGGQGGMGAVVIWRDLGVWPPCGQTPLATYGCPPPNPSCSNGRAYAFIM